MSSPIVGPIREGFSKLWPMQFMDKAQQYGDTIRQDVTPLLQKMGLMQKPDTSWHDQMLRQANQSFRDAAQNPGLTTMSKPLKDR